MAGTRKRLPAAKTFAQRSKEKGGCDMTLKELRKQSKKSAAEVAAVLGVARSTLGNYEQGLRWIHVAYIIPLAEFYDVTEREVIEAQIESVKERKKE
jgi:transcriptional regulator with XRE-family HTH domain